MVPTLCCSAHHPSSTRERTKRRNRNEGTFLYSKLSASLLSSKRSDRTQFLWWEFLVLANLGKEGGMCVCAEVHTQVPFLGHQMLLLTLVHKECCTERCSRDSAHQVFRVPSYTPWTTLRLCWGHVTSYGLWLNWVSSVTPRIRQLAKVSPSSLLPFSRDCSLLKV